MSKLRSLVEQHAQARRKAAAERYVRLLTETSQGDTANIDELLAVASTLGRPEHEIEADASAILEFRRCAELARELPARMAANKAVRDTAEVDAWFVQAQEKLRADYDAQIKAIRLKYRDANLAESESRAAVEQLRGKLSVKINEVFPDPAIKPECLRYRPE